MNPTKMTRLALLLSGLTLVLACRTADTIALIRSTSTPAPIRTTRAATRLPTRLADINSHQVAVSPTVMLAITEPPLPAEAAAPPPTHPPQFKAPSPAPATRGQAPRATALPTNTTIPPTPTSQFAYRIQESRCGPNVRTYIEGYVYEGSVPKNDVLVRISQGPDGQPDPNDDFRTGSDPRKGYYFHNIDANAPHEGLWYLWVMDPNTQQRISEIAIVKTDKERVEDSESSAGSCQSAIVTFSTTGPKPTVRTPTPSRTRDPNATPTLTPTTDPLDDSS